MTQAASIAADCQPLKGVPHIAAKRPRPPSDGNRRRGSGSGTRDGKAGEPSEERVVAHRRRQKSIAEILDKTFGKLAKCHPDLWERRAYLMLVGLTYERLATNEKEISNTELVSLAKVLADNRRIEARTRAADSPEETPDTPAPGDKSLPVKLTGVVRQVYGTNLQSGGQKDSADAGGT